MTPLLWAVFKGHVAVVDILWAHSKVTLRDSNRRAALHLAAMADATENSRNEMVKYLLEKDADMGSRDKYGSTPLHIAVKARHEGTVKLLLPKGKDEWDDEDMKKAMRVAAWNGETAILGILLDSILSLMFMMFMSRVLVILRTTSSLITQILRHLYYIWRRNMGMQQRWSCY